MTSLPEDKKPAKAKRKQTSEEYDNFVEMTRKLLAVPKAEIDLERKKKNEEPNPKED